MKSTQTGAHALATIAPWLAPQLAHALLNVSSALAEQIEEIRLRAERPLQLVTATCDWFLDARGEPTTDPAAAQRLASSLVDKTWQIMCAASVYRFEEQTRQGFLTLPGGHRVGVAGHALREHGRVIRQRDIASLNVRVARAVPGCADAVLNR